MDKILERILSDVDISNIHQKLNQLSMSDFNSLMLKLYKERTENITAPNLLRNFVSNRFVTPSTIDAVAYCGLESKILSFSRQNGIEPILLSPAAPLGSCSVFGAVDQNNVVSALRGTEILSDATNMLALVLAERVKNGADNRNGIHLSCCSRLTRAQAFSGAGLLSNFGIFGIVSSGKDAGSYKCEGELLTKHISLYRDFFDQQYNIKLSVVLRKRSGYTDGNGFFNCMLSLIKETLPNVPVTIDESNIGNNYYKGINFKIYVSTETETIELGDGGFTDWTQQLLGNKKERCLISGIGIDRLLLL